MWCQNIEAMIHLTQKKFICIQNIFRNSEYDTWTVGPRLENLFNSFIQQGWLVLIQSSCFLIWCLGYFQFLENRIFRMLGSLLKVSWSQIYSPSTYHAFRNWFHYVPVFHLFLTGKIGRFLDQFDSGRHRFILFALLWAAGLSSLTHFHLPIELWAYRPVIHGLPWGCTFSLWAFAWGILAG